MRSIFARFGYYTGLAALLACGRPPAATAVAPTAPFATPSAPTPSSTMQLPPIVQAGTPVLRSRAEEVPASRIATPEIQELIKTMIATMRAAPGVGLAAPQIGVPWRVIVLEDREELLGKLTPPERAERERTPFTTRVFINPVLRLLPSEGSEPPMFFEGCLSVKGYVGLVERSREVEVTGLDEHGAKQTWRAKGWPARILQHEVDHLEGTLYIDRMKTRSFANADEAKARFGGKPIAEVRRMLGL